MNLLRKILFPFSAIYGAITALRNYLFDTGYLKSYKFEVPTIVVGNLSVGGTGKTPQVEYLIRLLSRHYQVATLSRGYKRLSKGYILANQNADAQILGDEPYQFFTKFPKIRVAVDADRVRGVSNLLKTNPPPSVILLDDAFQHRRIKADVYILLTTYGELYVDDFMLPTGNLRESRHSAKRADLIVVTKCPPNLTHDEQQLIKRKLQAKPHQSVFFSYTEYDENVYGEAATLPLETVQQQHKILLSGIANPKHFVATLFRDGDLVLKFPDHHHFSEKEILHIISNIQDRLIITTEKDYMRLKNRLPAEKLYYLPIKSAFLCESDKFDRYILDFVASKLETKF